MKSTSFLHHFGHSLHHSYIKIEGFYTISTPSKNPPAKSLHRFYTIISDFYTVPTLKFSVSTPFLHQKNFIYFYIAEISIVNDPATAQTKVRDFPENLNPCHSCGLKPLITNIQNNRMNI